MDEILPERVSLCEGGPVADGGLSAERVEELHDFYTVERDGKQIKRLRFRRLATLDMIRKRIGIFRFDVSGQGHVFVKNDGGRLRILDETQIRDYVEDYLRSLPKRWITFNKGEDNETTLEITPAFIVDSWLGVLTNYESLFDRLRPEGEMLCVEDTVREKWLFYENGMLRVTKEGTEMLPYGRDGRCVWESQILKREFHRVESKGIFERFIENVTGREPEGQQYRKRAMMSYIGYLLHWNFERNMKVVIFTDTNQGGAEKANGRTGKSLIGKAIARMLNREWDTDKVCVTIDGKSFDVGNDKKFMECNVNTRVIFINDVLKYFSLDRLYNAIEGGVYVRKLHRDGFTIWAKMMIATNQTIRIEGASEWGRVILCELDNYYNETFTPVDEFGKFFFQSEFTRLDWLEFDNFMVRCVELYMREGLVNSINVNYMDRMLLEHLGEDFVMWFGAYVREYKDAGEVYVSKPRLWEEWHTRYPEHDRIKSPNKLTYSVKRYLDARKIPYVTYRGTVDYFVLNPSRETLDKAASQKKVE